MKYNIGDTVFLKGKVVGFNRDYDYPYHVEFSDGTDDWMDEYDLVDEVKDYNKGLEDAWELAKKLILNETEYDSFGYHGVKVIFKKLPYEVFRDMTPQEAFARIEEHEERKREIFKDEYDVGDVAKTKDGKLCVVSSIAKDAVYVLTYADGSSERVGCHEAKSYLTKTGRKMDIRSLLDELE